MSEEFRLFPVQASDLAPEVDAIYIFLLVLTTVISVGIFTTIIYFAIKYRRSSTADRRLRGGSYLPLELTWSIAPLIVSMIIFYWGLRVFLHQAIPPDKAINIYVVGKQWMWKLQHGEGSREINDLHVPVGYPVKLTMISQDVIHSFYVPAFRIKQDVLPGRYVTTWFKATKPGEYHLFCAEYCGTEHSLMRGRVIAMDPADYQNWLQGSAQTQASRGRELFLRYRCIGCHGEQTQVRAPRLEGEWGRTVPLADGTTVNFDENYARESILRPKAKVVAGYEPLMPTFEGQINEEDMVDLIQYIKSLGATARTPDTP